VGSLSLVHPESIYSVAGRGIRLRCGEVSGFFCWVHFQEGSSIMKRFALLTMAVGLFLPLLASAPAHAQAPRTWVSGVGDDVNPCSRTAPCKTFAGAISKTATNGEIDCLDPGGYGAVTITKSITIDCTGTFGSVLVAGTNGITINITNAGGTDPLQTVRLRGLLTRNSYPHSFIDVDDEDYEGTDGIDFRLLDSDEDGIPAAVPRVTIRKA